MFQMFGFGGIRCPRCEHSNTGAAVYCAQCGLTLGAPRNEPVLRDNRWIAGPDELAVFFGVRELSGLFVKTLRVPATTRAYILQADKATEVPQGEYEIEGFFTRLNHLLRDDHAEILITRSAALPVAFAFDDLHSAECLKLSADFTVSVRIERLPTNSATSWRTDGASSSCRCTVLTTPGTVMKWRANAATFSILMATVKRADTFRCSAVCRSSNENSTGSAALRVIRISAF